MQGARRPAPHDCACRVLACIRELEKVFPVDRIRHPNRRSLDEQVFECRDRKRALPTIRLRYKYPAWPRPIRARTEREMRTATKWTATKPPIWFFFANPQQLRASFLLGGDHRG
jgi:hypothetical protein